MQETDASTGSLQGQLVTLKQQNSSLQSSLADMEYQLEQLPKQYASELELEKGKLTSTQIKSSQELQSLQSQMKFLKQNEDSLQSENLQLKTQLEK